MTLLDYREAARDVETFSALTGPQRERHLKLLKSGISKKFSIVPFWRSFNI